MVWLAHNSADGTWVDVPKTGPRWLVRSNQLPTLRWWGLVERMYNEDDPTKKHSGHWRVTQKGIEFANNQLEVPQKVFTYNAEVESFGDEMVRIADCVDHFDYSTVMETTYD
jgi:hypothetical protein